MKNEQVEETIYNPYNENNKEITHKGVQAILNQFNVYYCLLYTSDAADE